MDPVGKRAIRTFTSYLRAGAGSSQRRKITSFRRVDAVTSRGDGRSDNLAVLRALVLVGPELPAIGLGSAEARDQAKRQRDSHHKE